MLAKGEGGGLILCAGKHRAQQGAVKVNVPAMVTKVGIIHVHCSHSGKCFLLSQHRLYTRLHKVCFLPQNKLE